MANKPLPKVPINTKHFEMIMRSLHLTYQDLSEIRGIDRTAETIRENVLNGEMPIHTTICIAYNLGIPLSSFVPKKAIRKEVYILLELFNFNELIEIRSLIEKMTERK